MVVFPNAKINIGLHVIEKRADQYHNLETVFYPINLYDVLEVVEAKATGFFASGIPVDADLGSNSCMQAYRLLAQHYQLPPVNIFLHKHIPLGAGLGGGSSDAAFMLKLLNEKFDLKLSYEELVGYARRLGADCPFFIRNEPVFARGIGDVFTKIPLDLSTFYMVIVKPALKISTVEAYGKIDPRGERGLLKSVQSPIAQWKDLISNDFEDLMGGEHEVIGHIKEYLYEKRAVFAAMSGSGSALFGIFKEKVNFPELEEKYSVYYC